MILSTLPVEAVDLAAMESADRRPAKGGPFQPELNAYTPLMLAVIGPTPSLDCVKALLAAQADYRVRDKITGSNLLHLAAEKCSSDAVFEYLFKNLKVDVFARNDAGHTPLTLCEASPWKSPQRVACIEEV